MNIQNIDRNNYCLDDEDTEMQAAMEKSKKDILFKVSIILRVHLEQKDVNIFGPIMTAMIDKGFPSYEPPRYDVSDLTERRQEARTAAVANAASRANAMLRGLDSGNRLVLGAPICILDVPVNIQDDASDSCSCNPNYHYFVAKRKDRDDDDEAQGEDGDGSESTERAAKRACLESLQSSVGDLFALPSVTVAAMVKVIFEVN